MRDKVKMLKGLLGDMADSSKIDFLRKDFDKIYGKVLKKEQKDKQSENKKIKSRKKNKMIKKQKQKTR
jgi:hypothetical protein